MTEEMERAGSTTYYREHLGQQWEEEDTKVISRQAGLTAHRGSAWQRGLTVGF